MTKPPKPNMLSQFLGIGLLLIFFSLSIIPATKYGSYNLNTWACFAGLIIISICLGLRTAHFVSRRNANSKQPEGEPRT
jgi:uncharacterized membrane protein